MLVPRIRSGNLPPTPSTDYEPQNFDPEDPVTSVHRMTKDIALRYSLPKPMVIVSFRDDLHVAGRIDVSGQSGAYFVEVRGEMRRDPQRLAAVMGHEVAHLFLHRHSIRMAETLDNEILTDVAAATYGFGFLMADAFYDETTWHGNYERRVFSWMGYLSPEELGYVLCKTGRSQRVRQLTHGSSRVAVRRGIRLASCEATAAPRTTAGLVRHGLYKAARCIASHGFGSNRLHERKHYAFEKEHVLLRCAECCQAMRLPQWTSLLATCPTCGHRFECRT